ncbi:MAG: DNA-3-methyladenine glycosylase 2 family protein [Planctomycetota bacterium]
MPRVPMWHAVQELARKDRVMAGLVRERAPCRLPSRPRWSHFAFLARSIAFQQLATAAAEKIHGRFEALMGGDVTADGVLLLRPGKMRASGLSENKVRSVIDLATRVRDGSVRLDGIARLDDASIVKRLVAVRGIGPWTAEMFLMFQLRRLDVWPVLDYGVRKGYQKLYGLEELPKPGELLPLGERFRPYRSVAAWYCWRALEGE